MSVFRPAVRVTGPAGRTWEIYAYKLQVRRGPAAPWGLRDVLRVPRRFVVLGAAAVRALRSDAWTIEAVAWLPGRESYAWSTTSEYKGQVLAQVEGSLARGDVPQHLAHGRYLGRRGV